MRDEIIVRFERLEEALGNEIGGPSPRGMLEVANLEKVILSRREHTSWKLDRLERAIENGWSAVSALPLLRSIKADLAALGSATEGWGLSGPPKSYTIPEAMAATGAGRTLLYEEIAAGRLKARKWGAKTIILATDLMAFLAALPEKAADAELP